MGWACAQCTYRYFQGVSRTLNCAFHQHNNSYMHVAWGNLIASMHAIRAVCLTGMQVFWSVSGTLNCILTQLASKCILHAWCEAMFASMQFLTGAYISKALTYVPLYYCISSMHYAYSIGCGWALYPSVYKDFWAARSAAGVAMDGWQTKQENIYQQILMRWVVAAFYFCTHIFTDTKHDHFTPAAHGINMLTTKPIMIINPCCMCRQGNNTWVERSPLYSSH